MVCVFMLCSLIFLKRERETVWVGGQAVEEDLEWVGKGKIKYSMKTYFFNKNVGLTTTTKWKSTKPSWNIKNFKY